MAALVEGSQYLVRRRGQASKSHSSWEPGKEGGGRSRTSRGVRSFRSKLAFARPATALDRTSSLARRHFSRKVPRA
jgi:hypothetical protein